LGLNLTENSIGNIKILPKSLPPKILPKMERKRAFLREKFRPLKIMVRPKGATTKNQAIPLENQWIFSNKRLPNEDYLQKNKGKNEDLHKNAFL
jgi:hypothetical protein